MYSVYIIYKVIYFVFNFKINYTNIIFTSTHFTLKHKITIYPLYPDIYCCTPNPITIIIIITITKVNGTDYNYIQVMIAYQQIVSF